MQKLSLKVSRVLSNGAVILSPEKIREVEFLHNGKKINETQAAKLKDKSKLKRKNIYNRSFLNFIPSEGDKTAYKVGEIYEITLKKVK